MLNQDKSRDQNLGRVEAPWSKEQVDALNYFQESGVWHPFTSESGRTLIATEDGWIEEPGGRVVQTWAHAFMTDAEAIRERAAVLRGEISFPQSDDFSKEDF